MGGGGGKSARVGWREKYEEEQWEDKIMMDLGEIKGYRDGGREREGLSKRLIMWKGRK